MPCFLFAFFPSFHLLSLYISLPTFLIHNNVFTRRESCWFSKQNLANDSKRVLTLVKEMLCNISSIAVCTDAFVQSEKSGCPISELHPLIVHFQVTTLPRVEFQTYITCSNKLLILLFSLQLKKMILFWKQLTRIVGARSHRRKADAGFTKIYCLIFSIGKGVRNFWTWSRRGRQLSWWGAFFTPCRHART